MDAETFIVLAQKLYSKLDNGFPHRDIPWLDGAVGGVVRTPPGEQVNAADAERLLFQCREAGIPYELD